MSGSDNQQGGSSERFGLYGWSMVVVAAVLMCATLPGRTHGLGLITKRLIEDVEISKMDFAQINLWATLIGALFCLPCGWLIDRYGLRRVAVCVVMGLGVAVLMLAASRSMLQISFWVTLTRGFGQSMLSVVSITLIGKSVSNSLPIAMGVYSVLLSCMMAAATGLLGNQIVNFGWREAWGTQGLILLVVAIPCTLMIRRRSGARDDSPKATDKQQRTDATLAQAIRTPCFWIFACSISFFGLISSGLSLFNQFVIAERGFGESIYHHTLVIGLLAGLVANLATGAAARFISLRILLTIALLGLAVSLGVFPWVDQLWQVYTYAVGMGLAGGMLTVLFFTVWKHAYGRSHLGAIQGAAQMVTVFASAIGPLLVSASETVTGSYASVFLAASAISAASAVVASFISVPDASRGDWDPATIKSPTSETPDLCPANP
ncbi:MFS transporter [Gimesia maris]|uniref:MFS transporter n=1 Tax=Gimesia maris TaxID=122 RepID=UPI003A92C605